MAVFAPWPKRVVENRTVGSWAPTFAEARESAEAPALAVGDPGQFKTRSLGRPSSADRDASGPRVAGAQTLLALDTSSRPN